MEFNSFCTILKHFIFFRESSIFFRYKEGFNPPRNWVQTVTKAMNRRVVVDGWTIDLSLNKFEPQDTFSKSWIEKTRGFSWVYLSGNSIRLLSSKLTVRCGKSTDHFPRVYPQVFHVHPHIYCHLPQGTEDALDLNIGHSATPRSLSWNELMSPRLSLRLGAGFRALGTLW